MIEPEMAFYDINDNMDLAEEMLKYVISYVLDKCNDDLLFLENLEKNEASSYFLFAAVVLYLIPISLSLYFVSY